MTLESFSGTNVMKHVTYSSYQLKENISPFMIQSAYLFNQSGLCSYKKKIPTLKEVHSLWIAKLYFQLKADYKVALNKQL